MPYYTYKARTEDGKTLNGLVEAPNATVAARLLREKQLFVIHLDESKPNAITQTFGGPLRKVSFSEIVNFTRQLSTMIIAGLQLPDALGILRAQTTNALFGDMMLEIEHHVIGGGNLADALAKYPKYFSNTYLSLVRAGEASGTLERVLLRLSESLESQQEFRAKIKSAMIYPIIIVIGMIIVVIIMMTVVVPKLTEMYRDFGVTLPWTTQLLMSMSDFVVKFFPFIILGGFGGVFGFLKWKKTILGEFIWDSMLLKVPLVGDLLIKILLVDFTRTLGMLVGSGVHILEALKILQGTLDNVLFRNAIHEIAVRIEKGFPLGESFSQHEIFPPIVSQMMKVGEETGKLDETMLKLSQYFQSESEHTVKGLTTAIEPIIMVFLGIGVGFIVLAVITPIYSLTNSFK